VTLWEILTYAREQPFEDLGDEKVIENVTHFYQDDGQQVCAYSFKRNMCSV
jgi:discoidin domain receptor family protein 2